MASVHLRIWFVLLAFGVAPALAQAPPLRVQPGLEAAVKWKWSVLPSAKQDWGFPEDEPTVAGESSGGTAGGRPKSAFAIPAGEYEVKRGDALAKIARKSGISVDQIKSFNELTGDMIRIGQILKIPTLEEVLAMAPPPPPPVAKVVVEEGKEVEAEEEAKEAPPLPQINTPAEMVAEATLLQVLLDRENFPSGPIDGDKGAAFDQALVLYQGIHPDLSTPEELRQNAVEVAGQPYTSYRLKHSDFRFIEAAKEADRVVEPPPKARRGAKGVQAPKPLPPPAPTYDELVAASFSAYRTPWEFVAERFHCDEAFLRNLNPKLKEPPLEGAEFKVPNVIPFEVENCFAKPLQPAADAAAPVVAMIVGVSRLEIRKGGQLVAAMPISRARPGLYGKGTWTILAATPGPRLATRQQPTSATVADAPSDAEQFIAAGPRNPVGVCWIDLAKADSTTPLPYGLHGTSIPSRMKSQESIGGFRLANWDIARAVRMLPAGTPLEWK